MSPKPEPVFEPVATNADFPAIERDILTLWDELDAFNESNRRRHADSHFVFYDGPPFATGTPHYGHLLAGTIKDIVPRFWNMRGKRVERRFGWDCHGLPIEALAQEALGLSGTAAIQEVGIDTFNEQCRSMVQTYVGEWRKTVTRMGRWVDFDNDYKTMDRDFMESVWWVFKQLWDQGRVYKAHRIMPYSWALTTPLSNFEANSNYKEVQDPAITLRFRLTGGIPEAGNGEAYALAWTTTPWTLPANLALCVGPDITYAVVREQDSGAIFVLAEALVGTVFPDADAIEVMRTCPGSELAGSTYEPLLPYFADHQGSFRILTDAFVSTESGTGIVHMAPAYGEDDYRICSDAGIELVDPVDQDGRFTDAVPEFAGQMVKDADKGIMRLLKEQDKLVHQSTITHSYPFCERTDTPLIYKAIEAWYVRVEDLRGRLTELNDAIRWVPDYVGEKRFGNWLKDAKDWNISRNRFWGSCIPVWINEEDPSDTICIGSVAELEELSGKKVKDLHKHVVDQVVFTRDGKTYRRTPEVLDCWFESGSMPYAQQHFPFESEQDLGSFFPAHFIAEGLDQTRGWFYTLLILGTCLFDKAPYENVVVNGMILAEDGSKMSKRKKNYPDPNVVLDQYGADALRAYIINSPVVRGEPLRFSESGLKDILRTVVIPYWNALNFFVTYANVDSYDPRRWDTPPCSKRPDIDRWMLSVLQSLIRDVNHEMEAYRLYNVVPRLVGFIDDLTNWYIRSSRSRFWKSEDDADKASAFATLYRVLVDFAKLLAPFMPFLTEAVYQRLVVAIDDKSPACVHWCDYPQVAEALIDNALEQRMRVIRAAASLGRKLREEHKIKVRQPLSQVTIVHRDAHIGTAIEQGSNQIAKELNVKSVQWEQDESAFVDIVVKPNFQSLRQRCPHKIKDISKELQGWDGEQIARVESGGTVSCAGESLDQNDVLLQRKPKQGVVVATDGFITVALDPQLTPDLEREGLAREFISALQNARKDAGFEVTDRISVTWRSDSDKLATAITEHWETIANEVLASSVNTGDGDRDAKLNGEPLSFAVAKV